jgi:T4 bacteriophage base plate protein
MSEVNPLKKFYRGITTFIKLPSRGVYYKPGVVEFNEDQELGIMPMTAQDELLLKNPDALLSGQALVDVIKSCVPSIKTPRKLLSCDVDAIMIGIRAASYGNETSLNSTCPNSECKHENSFSLDLSSLLDTAETLDTHYEVVLSNGVTVFVTPGTFDSMVKNQRTMFEGTRLQRAILDPDISDEDRMKIIAQAFSKMTKMNFELIIDGLDKVVYTDETGEHEVTKKEFIIDFMKNITKSDADLIERKMVEINKIGIVQKLDAICTKCGHKWQAPIEFNPVNFS